MDTWNALRRGLAELGAQAPPSPATGRIGGALALLSETDDGDLELVLTERHEALAHHPGQISFPGGRVEVGETVEQAALREAAEECALEQTSVEVLGALPAFYIPPSRFWLQVVVGRWRDPHPLAPAEAEVEEILHVRFSQLRERKRWRVARLSSRGESWAWALEGDRLLWGATAMVTAVLLGLVDPDWSGGAAPGSLGADREVRPWERPGALAPRPMPARLPGVPEVARERLTRGAASAADGAAVARAGAVTAGAVRQLLTEAPPPGRRPAAVMPSDRSSLVSVLVLAGPGVTGAVGVAAAGAMAEAGLAVGVILPTGTEQPGAAALGDLVQPFGGDLPAADLVVDALVGRGLRGPLRGPVRDVVLALRGVAAPIVAVDLPSGLHPNEGLVGDMVAADVTLALGVPAEGLFHAGMAAFVGDLYLVGAAGLPGEDADPIVRVVAGQESIGAEPQ